MTRKSRAAAAALLAGGLLLRFSERRLGLPSGTLASYRAKVGPKASEIEAWREVTDRLVADAAPPRSRAVTCADASRVDWGEYKPSGYYDRAQTERGREASC